MRLLFNVVRLQYLRAFSWLPIEGGDVFGDRDIDAMLRFDLKSDIGRARPEDDAWVKLRARISEHEQQQAAQVYQPASPRVAASAWKSLNLFVPRLSQAVAALLLFIIVQGMAPPLFNATQVVDEQSGGQPVITLSAPRDTTAPQINRAYEVEGSLLSTAKTSTQSPPVIVGATRDDTDVVVPRRFIVSPRLAPEPVSKSDPMRLPAEDLVGLAANEAHVLPGYLKPE